MAALICCLLDPPYDDLQIEAALEDLSARVKPGGVVVISFPPNADVSLGLGYQLRSNQSLW